jgi:type IV fimbrial biogenesis protein FimT
VPRRRLALRAMQFAGQNKAMNTLSLTRTAHRRLLSGFSLIETMIVIVLVAIAATIALPSFRDTITRNTLATSINEFQMALSQARSEAIRSRFNTVLQSTPNKDWAEGWIIYIDKNYNSIFDGDDVQIYVHAAAAKGVTISDNNPKPGIFVFEPSGFPSFAGGGGVIRQIVFKMNDQYTSLCISLPGRARVVKGNGACL